MIDMLSQPNTAKNVPGQMVCLYGVYGTILYKAASVNIIIIGVAIHRNTCHIKIIDWATLTYWLMKSIKPCPKRGNNNDRISEIPIRKVKKTNKPCVAIQLRWFFWL